MDTSRYSQRGVSSGKEDVHAAISGLDKGIIPGAFCKVMPDLLGGDPDWCNIMHADGAAPKVAWLTFIGVRREIYRCGKELPRTLL